MQKIYYTKTLVRVAQELGAKITYSTFATIRKGNMERFGGILLDNRHLYEYERAVEVIREMCLYSGVEVADEDTRAELDKVKITAYQNSRLGSI